MKTLTLIFANISTQGSSSALLFIVVFVYIAATLFTIMHCAFRCENDDRIRYALTIALVPVAGAILYWKNRPDIFNAAIMMAYPHSTEKKDAKPEEKSNPPAASKFSSPPFPVASAKAPCYSSPPFPIPAAKHPLRVSNSTPPFTPASSGPAANLP